MEDTAIPYELPEVENHSFFFVDQRIPPVQRLSCTVMMRGSYITLFTAMVTAWQVIRYSPLQRAT